MILCELTSKILIFTMKEKIILKKKSIFLVFLSELKLDFAELRNREIINLDYIPICINFNF